jgi:queuosine precursor transporter
MRTLTSHIGHPGTGHSALFWPTLYFGAIVISNFMMVWLPMVPVFGVDIPPAIFVFGFVFVLRDFAQRALGHYVLGVMAAAAVVTYWFAGPAIAAASTTAFLISELADWAVFSITKRPFAQRILLSSLVSVPVDTAVFFLALGILDAWSLVVGIAVKLIGTAIFWTYLTFRSQPMEQPA